MKTIDNRNVFGKTLKKDAKSADRIPHSKQKGKRGSRKSIRTIISRHKNTRDDENERKYDVDALTIQFT